MLKYDDPVVLGFPSEGNPYFLSFFITKKNADSSYSTVRKVMNGEGAEDLPIPKPVYKVKIDYPEVPKKKKIEGMVMLSQSKWIGLKMQLLAW